MTRTILLLLFIDASPGCFYNNDFDRFRTGDASSGGAGGGGGMGGIGGAGGVDAANDGLGGSSGTDGGAPSWTRETVPTNLRIISLWGSGTNDIYAVAYGGGQGLGQILHSTGNGSWGRQTSGLPTTLNASAVWASGPNDIYVTSNDGNAGGTKLYHSVGADAWTTLTIPGPATYSNGIWGNTANNFYVGGNVDNIAHNSSGTWAAENCAGGSNDTILAIHSNPTLDLLLAVATNGRVCKWSSSMGWNYFSPPAPVGTSWTSVWVNSISDAYVIGSHVNAGQPTPDIYHYNGSMWTRQTAPSTTALRQLFALGSNSVYAAGDSGTVAQTDGSGNWMAMQIPNITQNLYAIWGTGPNDIYVAGDGGVIMHWH